MILDSGNRREFETGAVRDIVEGKGRCDLVPLTIAARLGPKEDDIWDFVLYYLGRFLEDEEKSCHWLITALHCFAKQAYSEDIPTMLLEVSKHFEEGAKKYGENNWQKGIPVNCYIDSAVRHYLKWKRGDEDENHARAVVWNILCCGWEVERIAKNREC